MVLPVQRSLLFYVNHHSTMSIYQFFQYKLERYQVVILASPSFFFLTDYISGLFEFCRGLLYGER